MGMSDLCAFRRERVHVHRRLLSRHPEVILADDVVAVEHATRHVAGHRHRDALGDTRPDHVPGRGTTQVVEQLVGDPGSLAGGGPSLAEISHGLTVSVEHQRGDSDVAVLLEQPGLPAMVNQLGEITFQHDGAPSAGFGRFGSEPNRSGVPVHVSPLIEAPRHEDPASADRFIALRDGQQEALAELQSTESRANAVPPVLRPSFLPQLKQARQKYVDSQLKILDFLDERDRGIVARLQEEIGRFKRELEGRQKSRDELKKLLSE
jgi:hypothetical protein